MNDTKTFRRYVLKSDGWFLSSVSQTYKMVYVTKERSGHVDSTGVRLIPKVFHSSDQAHKYLKARLPSELRKDWTIVEW